MTLLNPTRKKTRHKNKLPGSIYLVEKTKVIIKMISKAKIVNINHSLQTNFKAMTSTEFQFYLQDLGLDYLDKPLTQT